MTFSCKYSLLCALPVFFLSFFCQLIDAVYIKRGGWMCVFAAGRGPAEEFTTDVQ